MIDKSFAMNLLSSVRMPVGKYKGQDLDVIMASDPSYIEWISQQEWFRQQHTHIYKIIVNGYVDLQESPEHNALQARFLGEDLRIALANHLLPEITDTEVLTYGAESAFVERYYTRSGRFPRFSFGEQSLQVGNPAFEFQGVDVCFSAERYVEVSMRGSYREVHCVERIVGKCAAVFRFSERRSAPFERYRVVKTPTFTLFWPPITPRSEKCESVSC